MYHVLSSLDNKIYLDIWNQETSQRNSMGQIILNKTFSRGLCEDAEFKHQSLSQPLSQTPGILQDEAEKVSASQCPGAHRSLDSSSLTFQLLAVPLLRVICNSQLDPLTLETQFTSSYKYLSKSLECWYSSQLFFFLPLSSPT